MKANQPLPLDDAGEGSSTRETRTATCSCGGVRLVLAGEPRNVYACACLECQRSTGSAFAYRAIYPDRAIVSQIGRTKSWRRTGPSGQWLEQTFCTDCGSIVFMRAEALKQELSISAGCLADPHFPPPKIIHWANRKHCWLRLEGIPDALARPAA